MKTFLLVVVFLAVYCLGAVMHERDIARACAKLGESHQAGWTIDIKCSPNKAKRQHEATL